MEFLTVLTNILYRYPERYFFMRMIFLISDGAEA